MTEEEQEAGSWKYIALPVVALSSGRFAICGQFSNLEGLPIMGFVEPQDLHKLLFEAQEAIRNKPEIRVYHTKQSEPTLDLL